MIVRHYATESIVYMLGTSLTRGIYFLASNMDAGVQDYQLEAAIGKVLASENAWHVCDTAIQVFFKFLLIFLVTRGYGIYA